MKAKFKNSTIICLIVLMVIPGSLQKMYKLSEFEPDFFKLSNHPKLMLELETGLEDSENEWLAAFGDINADKG
jgi:hypothetical protein